MHSKKMTLNEYLVLHSVDSPISDFMFDKLRIPHGLTDRKMKQLHKDASIAQDKYREKREHYTQEYFEKVKSGEIVVPSERIY